MPSFAPCWAVSSISRWPFFSLSEVSDAVFPNEAAVSLVFSVVLSAVSSVLSAVAWVLEAASDLIRSSSLEAASSLDVASPLEIMVSPSASLALASSSVLDSCPDLWR